MYHFTGTCSMGPEADERAVVGEDGLVHGLEGVRVADASVIPLSPAANVMLPTYMVAERVAAAARGARCRRRASRSSPRRTPSGSSAMFRPKDRPLAPPGEDADPR